MDISLPVRTLDMQVRWIWQVRLGAALFVALALGLALLPPYHARDLRMPDPWAYQFAIDSYAHGRLTVSDEQLAAGRMKARLQGGEVTQYVPLGNGRWAFEKSPGYPLLVAPFAALGAPRLANALLVIVAALALYVALAQSYGEGIACAGVGLLLLSPLNLMALHQTDMDTFASGALLVCGAALALWVQQRGLAPMRRTVLAAGGAGLALGWAVVTRLPNALIVLPFAAWWMYRCVRRRPNRAKLVAFGLGIALALAALAVYNFAVFGSLLDTGYARSLYTPDFAWSTNGRDIAGTPVGTENAVAILIGQVAMWAQPALIGLPLLLLAMYGVLVGQRRHGVVRDCAQAGAVQPMPLLPRPIAVAWILAVYAPYAGLFFYGVARELGNAFNRTWGFYAVDRYLYPLAFAVVALAVAALARLPRPLAVVFTVILCGAGVLLYWRALTAI